MISPSHLQAIRERAKSIPTEIEFSTKNLTPAGAFILHAHTDIPALLAHLDEQAEEIERLRKALGVIRSYVVPWITPEYSKIQDILISVDQVAQEALSPSQE